MSTNTQPHRGLRFLLGVLGVLLLAEAAGGALVVESLRQRSATHAGAANRLERDVVDAGRKERSVEAELALALHPDVLKTRIGTAMAPPQAKQIVWVRAAAPVNRQQDNPALPRVAFRVALVEPGPTEEPIR